MPKIPVDKLLTPISADQPCGPPLDEDIELGNLWREIETDAKGTPEQQFGKTIIEAKPGDWKKVHAKCVKLLESTRHLEPAIYLCAASIDQDGIPGLRDGLKLIHGLIEKFWDSLYPLADEDDPEDFWEREGILNLLTPAYQETPDDLLKFVERIRTSFLAQAPQVGRVSHKDILICRSKAQGAPTEEFIIAAFAQTDPEFIEKVKVAASESKELLESIRAILEDKMGDSAPDLVHLIAEVNEIVKVIPTMMGGGVEPSAQSTDPGAGNPATAPAPAAGVPGQAVAAVATPGVLNSRADVITALNSVITYYKANEPANPVPLLLQRAKALVDNDFLGIIRNFRPDLERDFLAILGVAEADGGKARPAAPAHVPAPAAKPAAAQQPQQSKPADDPWASASF